MKISTRSQKTSWGSLMVSSNMKTDHMQLTVMTFYCISIIYECDEFQYVSVFMLCCCCWFGSSSSDGAPCVTGTGTCAGCGHTTLMGASPSVCHCTMGGSKSNFSIFLLHRSLIIGKHGTVTIDLRPRVSSGRVRQSELLASTS